MNHNEKPTRLFDIPPISVARLGRRPSFRFRGKEMGALLYMRSADWLAQALLRHGLHRGEAVAIIAENRPEWNVVDMAVMQAGGVLLPLCAGLTAEEYVECMLQAQVRILFLEDKETLERFKLILPQIDTLKYVVTLDATKEVQAYEKWLEEGREPGMEGELAKRRNLVTTDDVCALSYMGGGVCNRLTHRAILADVVEQAANESTRRQAAAGNNALCTLYGRTKNYVCQLAGRTVNYPSAE